MDKNILGRWASVALELIFERQFPLLSLPGKNAQTESGPQRCRWVSKMASLPRCKTCETRSRVDHVQCVSASVLIVPVGNHVPGELNVDVANKTTRDSTAPQTPTTWPQTRLSFPPAPSVRRESTGGERGDVDLRVEHAVHVPPDGCALSEVRPALARCS